MTLAAVAVAIHSVGVAKAGQCDFGLPLDRTNVDGPALSRKPPLLPQVPHLLERAVRQRLELRPTNFASEPTTPERQRRPMDTACLHARRDRGGVGPERRGWPKQRRPACLSRASHQKPGGLPLPLWHDILTRIVRRALATRQPGDVHRLLTTCRSFAAVLHAMPVFERLRYVCEDLATVHLNWRAPLIYPRDGLTLSAFSHHRTRDEDRDMAVSLLKRAFGRLQSDLTFRQPPWSDVMAEDLGGDFLARATAALEQFAVQRRHVLEWLDRPRPARLDHRDATVFLRRITTPPCLSTRVFIRRPHGILARVGVSTPCCWLGSARLLYWLCQHRRQLQPPHAPMTGDAARESGLTDLTAAFVRWYQIGCMRF